MNFIISASTDVGIKKSTNQDSLSIKTVMTNQGRMTFAIICDGMGGLSKGEVASASVVNAFNDWLINDFPLLCGAPIEDDVIKEQWETIIIRQNEKIINYGKRHGINLGTTLVAMLLTGQRYYIMNIGDSRAYELTTELKQITNDQTLVAREIQQGNITKEEAAEDPRRNILLQCIGASNEIFPDMFCGNSRYNAVYMLCSDGFVHRITPEEIFDNLQPEVLLDADTMKKNTDRLIELNKLRQEQDNISVALVRTF